MLLQRGEVLGYDFNRMVVDFTMFNQGKTVRCAISTAAMDDLEGKHDVRADQRVDQFVRLRDEARRIERTFRFHNFREALAFVQQVGELAESEGHHPDISFGWGRATVSLSTKKIKGLHENDFIMAAKLDRIAAASVS